MLRMGRMEIALLEPGMVLAAPVHRGGRTVIPKGVALTQRHLDALRMWDIPNVEIEDDASPEVVVTSAHVLQAREKLKTRFSTVDARHPFLRELALWCVQDEARRIAQAETADG